jgi:hypothetical protein
VKYRKALHIWLRNKANRLFATVPLCYNGWTPPHLNAENNRKIGGIKANRSHWKVQRLHSMMWSPNSSHQGLFVTKRFRNTNAWSSVKWFWGKL